MATGKRRSGIRFFALTGILIGALLSSPSTQLGAAESAAMKKPAQESAAATGKTGGERKKPGLQGETITQEGIKIDFSAKTVQGFGGGGENILAGDLVELTFRMTDASSGEPLVGQYPGAWVDITGELGENPLGKMIGCRERVGMYLQGYIGIRPMVDLNSYYLLVMNQDPTIAVIDPIVGISGITKLYAQVILKRAGADWAKTKDEKRLFVSMPVADLVGVVDLETFKLTHNLPAGDTPLRVRLQPDGKYLWVGNNSRMEEKSGVTVIDAGSLAVAAFIPTGKGHHEIAITDDSRYVFVTNRDGGTVSVIDVQKLAKVKDIETGPLPISLAYSALSKSFYVADGEKGTITVIDGTSHSVVTTIEAKPGLGQMGFSQDGRWGVAVNSREDLAHVVDPSTNRITHSLTVGDEPYQVAFSRSFAYVRSLGTERVSMINLAELTSVETIPVVTFPAGQTPPKKAGDVAIADTIMEAPGEAAVLVVSPADATVYYYMEGMNAPMGNFRNYGHRPRAVQVADRAMREKQPGVFSAVVRIPAEGDYEVAFLTESPSILHCFKMKAEKNPYLKPKGPPITVEYLVKDRRVETGGTYNLRFRLKDRETGEPRADLTGVSVLNVMAPGTTKAVTPARHVGEGVYESRVAIPRKGAYYLYVGISSLDVNYQDLVYLSLIGTPKEKGK